MRRRTPTLLLLAVALLGLGLLAGCGNEEDPLEAEEGEVLELDGLAYTVQLTRFLNPSSEEDSAYLRDLELPPQGSDYLGVFMRIENETDETQTAPAELPIIDTRDQTFEPIETDSPFALELGAEIPPEGELPPPNSPAASGPVQGALVLYLLEEGVTENRPLELEIPTAEGEFAKVELDL